MKKEKEKERIVLLYNYDMFKHGDFTLVKTDAPKEDVEYAIAKVSQLRDENEVYNSVDDYTIIQLMLESLGYTFTQIKYEIIN